MAALEFYSFCSGVSLVNFGIFHCIIFDNMVDTDSVILTVSCCLFRQYKNENRNGAIGVVYQEFHH
jgi:hypothetical protein